MIRPHSCSRMWGSTAAAQFSGPKALTAKNACQRSGVSSWNCVRFITGGMPALFTRMSTGPSSAAIRATPSCTAS